MGENNETGSLKFQQPPLLAAQFFRRFPHPGSRKNFRPSPPLPLQFLCFPEKDRYIVFNIFTVIVFNGLYYYQMTDLRSSCDEIPVEFIVAECTCLPLLRCFTH